MMYYYGKTINRVVALTVITVLLLSMSFTYFVPGAQAAGTLRDVTAPDGRFYKLYIPSGYSAGTPLPLVVMLHGCTQDAATFVTGTEMNALAEAENFIVAYPQQPSSANSSKCWNWFDTGHQVRNAGEPKSIVGVVNHIKSNYSVDEQRVYATGISAGAAMSIILAATYPDVFAAVGCNSGLEYKAAESMNGAWTAMFSGGPDPIVCGNKAYQAMGGYARVVPTMVIHGTSDYTVVTKNGDLVLTQMAQTNDRAYDGADNNEIDDVPEQTIPGTENGRDFTRYVYNNSATGEIVLEKYMINGMGHAWSGGNTAGSFTDAKGPKSSVLFWNFFKNYTLDGDVEDTTPPVTTATPAGGTYDNSVTVTLSANEPATTYYTIDGSTPTTSSPVYNAPLTFNSDTTLKYFSVDEAGNAETVKTQNYTIRIVEDTTPPVTTASPAGGAYLESVTVALTVNESATTYYTIDGSSPTTGSPVYNAPLTFTEDTTLKFFSIDVKGNVETVKTENYTINQPPPGQTFTSIGEEDGFAGLYFAYGYGSDVQKLGDNGMFSGETFRTILSFDTDTLADDAIITSAKLRIYRKSMSGTVSAIKADIIRGYFGTSSAIAQADYSAGIPAGSGAADIVSFNAPAADNDYVEVELPASALQYINKTGRTQFRLKATTNIDFAADLLEIYGGEDVGYAPQLILTFN